MMPATPGMVLAVWTGAGWTQDAIRIGDVLEGKPAVANHVVGITHKDPAGRWIGLEGRPGGFGIVDCTPYLNDSRTRGNYDQATEFMPAEVKTLLAGAAKLTGTPYDWVGIAEDDFRAFRLDSFVPVVNQLWRWPTKEDLLPGHVVCSSAWAWLYEYIKKPHPEGGNERVCTPGDWWQFNDSQAWRS
jgi:hypothetical protein